MTARKSWLLPLVGLAIVVGLPAAGHWARHHADPGCALDGLKVEPAYRVQVVDARGAAHAFCSLRCAEIWLARQQAPPRSITVTDEESGRGIDAASAWYVRSSVVTAPATGSRIHVFRRRADAERHAETFGGTVLTGSEKPFHPGSFATGGNATAPLGP